MHKLWKIGCFINICVITMILYVQNFRPKEELLAVYGCTDCFIYRLVLCIWGSIGLISIYCLFTSNKHLAKGLYTFQLLYKILAWLLLDIAVKNPITQTNVLIIPFIFLSWYSI